MSEATEETREESNIRERSESAADTDGSGLSAEDRIETEALEPGRPAVGVVATEQNDEQVARVVMRARSNDLRVLITAIDSGSSAVADLENIPGVHFIPVDGEPTGPWSDVVARQRLAAAARALSCSELIFVEDPSERVDFERSLSVEDGFIKRAIPAELDEDVRTLVAIPAYNEEATVASVVEEARRFTDDVMVVDDGSADDTDTAAREAGATVVSHQRNRGYGGALQTAFEKAELHDVDCLVVIDGDGQHDSSDVEVLAEKVVDGEANVAIGSRFTGESAVEVPLYRRFGIGIINVMSNVSMGALNPTTWVSDTQSGFRAYDREAIETLAAADLGDDMDASLDILYHLHEEGFEIEEIPTVVDYDVDNGHSQNPVTHGLRLLRTILRTVERDHPVLALGVPGFVLTLLGFVAGYVTIVNYLTTQTFPLGIALVSVFCVMLGVFSGFTAIVLHSLQAHLGRLQHR